MSKILRLFTNGKNSSNPDFNNYIFNTKTDIKKKFK